MIRDWNEIVMAYDNAGNALDHIMIGENIVWRFKNSSSDDTFTFEMCNYKIGNYPNIVNDECYWITDFDEQMMVAFDVLIKFSDATKISTLTLSQFRTRYTAFAQIDENGTQWAGREHMKYIGKHSNNIGIYRLWVLCTDSPSKPINSFRLRYYDKMLGQVDITQIRYVTYKFYTDSNKTTELIFASPNANNALYNSNKKNTTSYDPTLDSGIEKDDPLNI